MGFLSFLLGSKDILDKTDNLANRALDGIDHLFYTDQEKAEHKGKFIDANLEFIKAQRDENSVRSRARRAIAIIVVANYLVLLNFGVIMWQYDKEYAAFIFKTAGALTLIVGTIIGFYFGYYAVKSIVKSIKGK